MFCIYFKVINFVNAFCVIFLCIFYYFFYRSIDEYCYCIKKMEGGEYLRVEKVLKEPGAEHRDGPLREAALGPPWVALHNAHLLESPLLPQSLVKEPQPRRLTTCRPRSSRHCSVLLPQGLLCIPNLANNPIPQAPEMPRHRLRGQRRVHRCRPVPRHLLERGHHRLHLITVVPVSPVHLCT